MLSKAKQKEALRLLAAAYPEAKPALEFRSPFELLVATMLSAQCTDKQVNKCTRVLFPLYNRPEQFAALTLEELEPYIHSCGFFRTKGKHIIETAQILCREYGGELPRDRDALTRLPGVGRKTANVVVSNAFDIPAIAVDTHVFRVANRIGLAEATTVEKTERQLMQNIPEADWSRAHHWLIYHGRQVCAAQRPKCELCPLLGLCAHASAQKGVPGKAKSAG
ncbi:MAG: endonuclease III [Clostridia bacterium]|nr:endonuclease III [Clostridia bacterium]